MRRRFAQNSKSEAPFDINNYLTIEALEDNLFVSCTYALEYGVDGKGWTFLRAGESTPKINAGQTISFRGTVKLDIGNSFSFNINKLCNLIGNCMSVLFGDDTEDNCILNDRTLAYLFYNCTTIKSVSANFLPATTLASNCYENMFKGCTSLTTAPELPATTLASNCYENMFKGCTSLTTAPELPATTLASNCYRNMFDGCSKLNYIKMRATDISASSCLYNWVQGVASKGTFVKNKNATWNVTGVNGVPSGWTIQKV